MHAHQGCGEEMGAAVAPLGLGRIAGGGRERHREGAGETLVACLDPALDLGIGGTLLHRRIADEATTPVAALLDAADHSVEHRLDALAPGSLRVAQVPDDGGDLALVVALEGGEEK